MTRTIPMVDLKSQYASLKDEIDGAIAGVLQEGRFVLGPNVRRFEQEVAAYLGAAHAVGCASGTDALQLALTAAGIGPGAEVITTAFTFAATAEAVVQAGATPVFVDIDPHSLNIDVARVEAALTPRTAAVIPVHLFGRPADMAALGELCAARGILLVEDCAQSFGARVQGRHTGAIGAFGCFSFFPSKNLGCYGDGGLVTTSCPAMADRLRALRNHGAVARYHHDLIGFNSRLDEIQAAILRVKLRHIDRFNAGRRRIAHRYDALLAGLPLETPQEDEHGEHVYHQYTVLCTARERVMEALAGAGIECTIHYPVPLHRQPAFAAYGAGLSLPVAESVAERCLSLPIYPEIPDEDVERVAAVVRGALE
ncbi:DegT/DnrJ/EryC1/StrS family aminotransferase [Azotobacter armeniacus]